MEAQAGSLQEEADVLAEQAVDLRSRIGQHRQRRDGLHEEVTLSRREISGVEREIQELERAWQQANEQAEAAERQVHAIQVRLEEADREIRGREQERQQQQQECTAARVSLAQVEERLAAVQLRQRQSESDLEQRRQERLQSEQQVKAARLRLEESQRTLLRASAALAHWYLEKEAAERRLAELATARDQQRQERQSMAEHAAAARDRWRAQQEQVHTRELEVNEVRHRRDTLVDRLREDYQIDLADLYRLQKSNDGAAATDSGARPDVPADDLQSAICNLQSIDPAVAHEEIAELRR
jgi:chromosome segregation protein